VIPVPLHAWMVSDRQTLETVKELLLEPPNS
jgi:hypothetical protein